MLRSLTLVGFLLSILTVLPLAKLEAAIIFFDQNATGCSNPDTDYDPATRTCGSGSNTVATTGAQMIASHVGGDTVYFRADTYNFGVHNSVKAGPSPSQKTIYARYQNETVTLRPSGTGRVFTFNNDSNVIVDGLIMDGANLTGNFSDVIKFEGTVSDNVEFLNCEIRNASFLVPGATRVQGMLINTPSANGLVKNCNIHHNGDDRFQHGIYAAYAVNWRFEGNLMHDNGGYGFQMYTNPVGLHILKNHIYHNCTAGGACSQTILSNDGHIFENNVTYDIATSTNTGLEIRYTTPTGIIVRNNTFYGTGAGYGIAVYEGTGHTIINNISLNHGTNIYNPAGATLTTNKTTGTITDCTVSTTDFTHKAGSTCINAGTAISGVPFNGAAPDQGAFESFTFSSAVINEAFLDVTLGMSTNTPVQNLIAAQWSVSCTGANCGTPVVSNAQKLTGTDSQVRLTITGITTGVCAAGQTWKVSATATAATDSALIGGTLNQALTAFTDQAVTNGCGAAPPGDPGTPHWFYKLDDGTSGTTPTTANDESANNLDGTLTNGPQWATGKNGNAVHFTDQVASYIAVPYGSGVDPSTQDLTMCVGVKPDAGLEGATRSFFGPARGTNQRAYLSMTNTTWSMGIQGSFADTNLEFPVEAGWTRLCYRLDSGVATLFKNGVAGTSAQSVKNYTSFTFSSNFTLGSITDLNVSAAGGVTLDEPKLYTSALTNAEILTDFENWEPSPPAPTGSFEQKSHQFDSALIAGGHLAAVNASISARADTAFSLVLQTDCTGANCTPIGQRLHVSRNGGTFVPVQDVCAQDTICFFGPTSDPLYWSGAITTNLSGVLANVAGTTIYTSAATSFDLAQNNSIVNRYMLKSGNAMVDNDTFDFKLINQDGSAFSPDPPTNQARVTITPLTAIAAPASLHAVGSASNTLVDLVWAPVADITLAGYRVYRGTVQGGPYLAISGLITYASAATTNSSVTSFRTVEPVAGTFYYVVKAVDNNGNESAVSNEVTIVRTGFAARAPRVP